MDGCRCPLLTYTNYSHNGCAQTQTKMNSAKECFVPQVVRSYLNKLSLIANVYVYVLFVSFA